ncbi:MAG TPA: manganese catalase family protein [Nitrososphaeraceae archaeon]|nr:manganese catalase family protein [Nitrososphaeraceae archaeon]
MFISVNKLAIKLPKDKPDNLAANSLQEGLGGQFGEMRTMMQYLFQNFNFRGKAKPYQDLIKSALDGLPDGFDIPQMPQVPEEYSPGFDKELKQKAMSRP